MTTPLFSLRALLITDAVICGTAGILFSLAADSLAAWLALPAAGLFWVGVALLPVSLTMAIAAKLAPPPGWLVRLIIGGNLLWALGSFILPALNGLTPNSLGLALLLGQGAAVALLAGLEIHSLSAGNSALA